MQKRCYCIDSGGFNKRMYLFHNRKITVTKAQSIKNFYKLQVMLFWREEVNEHLPQSMIPVL